jgi:hypothetical protein
MTGLLLGRSPSYGHNRVATFGAVLDRQQTNLFVPHHIPSQYGWDVDQATGRTFEPVSLSKVFESHWRLELVYAAQPVRVVDTIPSRAALVELSVTQPVLDKRLVAWMVSSSCRAAVR